MRLLVGNRKHAAVELHSPRLPDLDLPGLDPDAHAESGERAATRAADVEDDAVEFRDDIDIDGADLQALRLGEQPVLHDVRLVRSRVRGVSFAGSHLKGLQLRDVRFEAVDAVGARWPEVAMMRIEFRDCRLSGIDLAQAALRHVRFIGCRLDAANLRMVDADHLRFEDCELRDIDFGSALLRSVGFEGSRLEAADFSNARCRDVDLRGARVMSIRGVAGLRGASIAPDQVLPLAPSVFADLGITIMD